MKTITLSGIIKSDRHQSNWNTIRLIQEDGYAINLLTRFQEAIDSFSQSKLTVHYWLAPKPCTKQQMQEEWLKKISGFTSVEFSQNDYQYSEYTSGTDYDTEFRIGNHNLLKILQTEEGKFLMMELIFDNNQK